LRPPGDPGPHLQIRGQLRRRVPGGECQDSQALQRGSLRRATGATSHQWRTPSSTMCLPRALAAAHRICGWGETESRSRHSTSSTPASCSW